MWHLHPTKCEGSWFYAAESNPAGLICCVLCTRSHSIFGFCNVPAWVYPWVLLAMLSIMISNVSFMGHLCGLLVGTPSVFVSLLQSPYAL